MKQIARLEAKLERLIEGMFGNSIHPHDIAVQLARAMEDGLISSQDGDKRPIAPDIYTIYLHPQVTQKFQDNLAELLQKHITELANLVDYRLIGKPRITIQADKNLSKNQIVIHVAHHATEANSTAAMQRVHVPQAARPQNPHLIINNNEQIALDADIINIGRHPDNQIILEDPYLSRHHVQLRLHQGAYILFDTRSRGGTQVNGVHVQEHRLSSGDVIKIGQTQMLYMQDEVDDTPEDEQTQTFDSLL